MMRNIETFGSMEYLQDKATPWGEILSELTRPKDEREDELSNIGVSDKFFQKTAEDKRIQAICNDDVKRN